MTDLAPLELNPCRKPTQGSGRSYNRRLDKSVSYNRRLDKSVRLLIHEWHYWWQVVPVYYVFNDPDSLHAQLCRLEDQDLRRSNEKGLYIYGRRNVQSARWVPKCEVNVKRNSKETLPAWSNMCFAHDTQENSFSTGKLAPRKNAGAWCRASSPDHFSHCTSFPRFVYIRGQEQGVRIQLSKEPDFCRSRKTFRWPADRWDSTSCRFGAPKLRVPLCKSFCWRDEILYLLNEIQSLVFLKSTCMGESCRTCAGVMSYIWISHVTQTNESCRTYEWVSHGTHMKESCHTGWVVSHKRMSHITRVNETCHICEWVMSGVWISHVTRVNESYHKREWGMSYLWMSHVMRVNQSCHACEWVISHVWMSHITHVNETCHICEWVMSFVWIGHVTRVNESCHTCK